MRYEAFISYSHADSRWAKWLQRSLEHYRVPKKLVAQYGLKRNRLNSIFLDRDELSSSSSLSGSIKTALENSENLIVVCSPASATSHWVNEEISTFKALGRGEHIYCLIVDGSDGEYFPPSLLDDEPLGVDVRSQADGKQNAKLKLISSLINVPFAILKDREQRRRTQIFAIAAGSAFLLAGVMGVLAISAVRSSHEAERQRLVATEALKDAQTVSEFLSTMLVEIDPQAMGNTVVEEIGGSQTLSALPEGFNSTDLARKLLDKHILNKASLAVATQFVEQPGIGARLDSALGASYHAIGLYDKAITSFTTSLALFRQHFGEKDSRTIDVHINLALSYLYAGQLDDALIIFQKVVQTSRESLGVRHDSTLAAMNGLAMTYTDLTRLEEARDLLEELGAFMVESKGRKDLKTIDVYSNLGWTLYKLGNYERAELITREQYELRLESLGPEAYETLSLLNNLALIYSKTDRLNEAEEAHRQEWQISQRTLGLDHPEVLVSMLNLSRVLGKLGKHGEALAMLTDALERAERVLPAVHPLLAAILFATGDETLELSDNAKALALYLRSQDIYKQLFEPDHPILVRLNESISHARL